MEDHSKIIEIIEDCTEISKLQAWVKNATKKGAWDVEDVARRRLVEVLAASSVDDGSDALVLDFWKSITALELVLSEERGKTIRLSRTRQKIERVGVKTTLEDLARKPTASEGYNLLRDRDMLDMSAEAVVLRFVDRFDDTVVSAARERLAQDGFRPLG